MAETSTTLQELRRALAMQLRMPFFRRFPLGYSEVAAGCTTTKLVDTKLTQPDNFWKNSWIYIPSTQESALVASSIKKDGFLWLESALATIPSAGTDYELYNVWNAYELHAAINQAIETVSRIYTETVRDASLIMCEDKMTYDISSLGIWSVNKVYLEDCASVNRGTVVSAGADSVTVTSATKGDADAGWMVSIYAGTGSGQIRNILSVAGEQLNLDVDWVVVPDSQSKIAIWNPNEQRRQDVPLSFLRLDVAEFPDSFTTRLQPANYGLRMFLEYERISPKLVDEDDATIVPTQYIILKAASILHGLLVGDNRVDRDLHYSEAQRLGEEAQKFIVQSAPHRPASQIRETGHSTLSPLSFADPLNWNGR